MIRGPTISNNWYFFSTNSSRIVDCDRKKRFMFRGIVYGSEMKTTVINEYILLYNSIYSTRCYVVMSHHIVYFLQNLLTLRLLFTNKERSGEVR